jgi:hypothetical protein
LYVVFIQPHAEPPGFGPHDRILLGVMLGPSPEDLDGDHGLLEFGVAAFEMAFDHESQKSCQALVTRESGARQNAFQLPPRGLYLGFRDGHCSSIPIVFSIVQVYETPFQPIRTCFSSAAGALCLMRAVPERKK